ncbi:MAG: DUF481 domain-containing protein [Gammaproteobacteria bacterium]|nr:DUF481 domain-containing protein [Gammaproteobacteria bacterium]
MPVEFRVSLDFLDILPGVMSLLKSCMGATFTTASRCFVLLSLTCCLVSETEAAPRLLAQAPAAPDAGRNWTTALPPTDRFDWLQTTSGEWLKGELKALYSGNLEFDSKKFKLRTLKMEDVARYLGHGIKRISIETPSGNRTVDGVVTIDRQRVIVVSREDMQSFDRSQLISIAPNAATEMDNWSGKVSFGFNYARGNTDQTDKIASLLIHRRTSENRLLINYQGQISDVNDAETINNHRLNLLYDVYPERGFFWRPIFFEFYHDPLQNIDHRATIGFGAGYHLLNKPSVTWNISGGPAYRVIQYDSVQSGNEDEADTPALVAGTFFDRELTSTVDFKTLYNSSIANRESGSYTHYAKATFNIELTSNLDFDISLAWDRTRDPQPRSDGSVPEQNDIQWLTTLGLEF